MLADVQSREDKRNIQIDKVGIKGVRYPITVLDRKRKFQSTVADINMYVLLPSQFRGTHMSRFMEILNENRYAIDIKKVRFILHEMKERLNAEESHIEIRFPYFLEREAPVTKEKSLASYKCGIEASSGRKDDIAVFVQVPISSVCPCSKEISSRGAHNQRSIVTIKVRFNKLVWLEELIEIGEKSGSSPVYPLLKREDEKFVTEYAYDHAYFVEDIARNAAQLLNKDERVFWYSVEVESFESIHNHNAYAYIERGSK
ncbi:MAG: GTP cyclohydrolase I FolE2 [Deltaproteobacteria bacterium]|nr:GTP cyclohydrolase I FolE2 [Deltaproteobacteria bacterium]